MSEDNILLSAACYLLVAVTSSLRRAGKLFTETKLAVACYYPQCTAGPWAHWPGSAGHNPSRQKIKEAPTYWIQLDVNARNSSYLYSDSTTLHLLTAFKFLYGLFESVIGASWKVRDGFQLYYFKLFITVFIWELLSLHYIIGLCKAGNDWLLGRERACVCVCVCVCVAECVDLRPLVYSGVYYGV